MKSGVRPQNKVGYAAGPCVRLLIHDIVRAALEFHVGEVGAQRARFLRNGTTISNRQATTWLAKNSQGHIDENLLSTPVSTMKIKDFARRHPVGMYFCLTFVISWLGTLATGGPIFLRGESAELEEIFVIGMLVLAGPSMAGLIMTYLVNGRRGLRDLFARMAKWRVGGRWYAALLIFPILLLAVSLTLSASVSPELSPIFFAPGIVMGLLAGSIEEIGWMGFAYPMMQAKRSILRTSLYLGFLHALWHMLPDFLANYHALGSHWLSYFTGFFVFVMALRVIIVWVYANTGSLLLAQLMHASSTGFFAILIPVGIAPVNWAIFNWVYAVVLSAVAVVIVARYGRNLRRQPDTARAQ